MKNLSKALTSYTYCKHLLKQDATKLTSIVQAFLKNIKSETSLNAFIRVYDQEVIDQVSNIITKLQKGKAGSLAGLVVGLKDMFCYKAHPVQAASRILDGFIAQFNASVVERLLKADALILGHQNCDEFGMGSATQHSIYGPTHHPIDANYVAGGSSGGSAASLSATLCHVSLGTDTGGSIRQPASFCGLVGLKPTYSLIPRDGVIAYASSFDTIGILAHDIKDCASVLEVIAGQSPYDNTSSRRSIPRYTDHLDWHGKAKIAYFNQALDHEGLDKTIKQQTKSFLHNLAHKGHQVQSIDFPLLEYTLPAYYLLSTAEASSNLARYDGVRYGYRYNQKNLRSVEDMYQKTRTNGFGQEVQRRILLGNYVLSTDYYHTYYLQAQKVRRLIQEHMKKIFTQFDFIVLPTTPTTAFLHHKQYQDPTSAYLADLYTVLASITGLPAISLPYGKNENGWPIGIQIITKAFQEKQLLAFSHDMIGRK